jgi:hypothetical protein
MLGYIFVGMCGFRNITLAHKLISSLRQHSPPSSITMHVNRTDTSVASSETVYDNSSSKLFTIIHAQLSRYVSISLRVIFKGI